MSIKLQFSKYLQMPTYSVPVSVLDLGNMASSLATTLSSRKK